MRHDSCVRARAAGVLAALVVSLASSAAAQPLPVVVEMNGGGDDRWESIQLNIGALHVDTQLPLAIAVIPCTQATAPGSGCDDDGSLHSTYQLWTSQHPTIIEVGQQGRDNRERLGTLGPVDQRALIEEGLAALVGWGLGNGEPLFFTPPGSSANSDTFAILEELGFQSVGQVAGTCATGGTDIDKLCNSVPLCQRNSAGGRVTGPACVVRSFDDLAAEIESRAGEGVVLVSYAPQDLSVSTLNQAIDATKRAAYEALLDAFAAAEADGRFELRTFDTHYRLERGLPLPTPETTPRPTPTPPVPTNLPVVFSEDDPEDGTWESATLRVHQEFIAEQVPRVQQTVACGAPSPTDGSACINTEFHLIYQDWVRANPDLVEIGHHGFTHDEVLTSLSREQQLDLISRGLAEMETWGLPDRPYTFAAPFSAVNADTVSVLEQLGYHSYVKNAGSCVGSATMEPFCDSVSLCELSSTGQRVSGPACVLKAPETLIAQVNAKAAQGEVFINFHVQDLYMPDLVTLDETKFDALRAILQAFRDEEIAGHYDLMTMETLYRLRRGLPTPGPGATPTATPPGPTATPTRTPVPPTPTIAPPTPTRTATPPTGGPTPTRTPRFGFRTPTPTPPTGAPTPTRTATPPTGAPTPTRTATPPTGGPTPTRTPFWFRTPTPTRTPPTGAPTPTRTATPPTGAPTPTRTATPATATPRPTRTPFFNF